jgi:hypothetical protein
VNDLRETIQHARKLKVHPLARIRKFLLDENYVAKRSHLIHKLKAKDRTGRWAYCFILVPKLMEQEFLDALNSEESIDLEDYGRVIASCYGEVPNAETKSLLKEKYGFSV